MNFRDLFRSKQQKKDTDETVEGFARKAKAFADDNPDTLLILGDSRTDVIFMAYKGVMAPIRILNKDGSRNYIVRNATRHQKSDADIDRFLLAVDGGLVAIADAIYSKQQSTLKGKVLGWVGEDKPPAHSAVELADGSKLSPIDTPHNNFHAMVVRSVLPMKEVCAVSSHGTLYILSLSSGSLVGGTEVIHLVAFPSVRKKILASRATIAVLRGSRV